MQEVVVEVQERNNPGKNESRRMRKQGLVPAVVYGGNKEPRSIAVDPKLLLKIFHSESGANTIFQLNLQGTDQRRHVMIKEYQVDPVKGALLHVDLVRIQMDEAIEVMVPIRIVGDAVGVKVDGGILDHVNREIRIESLPANIPEHIDIDVQPLKIGDTRRVSDIPQSDRFKIMSDPEQILVVISAPTKDEAETPVVDEAEVVATAEPEVIKKGKAASEGEEGKEENDEGGKQ
ncbi:MAG: 50S ribosomal protein L25 [Acidobacteriota bacterium]